MPAREKRVNPLSMIGPLGRRPSVTLFQRGTASDNIFKWTVPHHCLVTVSVAMHTDQLGLRIQGLPLPDHHQLTRHASYVCVGAVDRIQLRIPRCEKDNLEAHGELIATVAVGHLIERPLGENRGLAGEVVSCVGETRHFGATSL